MGFDIEMFYARNIYRRIRDCWNRPIASTPGAYTELVDRISDDSNWTFRFELYPLCMDLYIPNHIYVHCKSIPSVHGLVPNHVVSLYVCSTRC